MKLTINLKLRPSSEQHSYLVATLERANAACNVISETAWQTQTFGQYALHKATYYHIKVTSSLSAQMTIRCIAKVADAYKLDRNTPRTFRPHGSIAYDDRILSFKPGDHVSLWTVAGRQTIPFVCGEYQRRFLPQRQGEADLVYFRGTFYLSCTCTVEEPPETETSDLLGVDLGIVNIAMDSDGTGHSGAEVEHQRRVYAHRRRNLQRKRTPAARLKLRHLTGTQARYQRHVNHTISKILVSTAQRTGRGLALENLQGIRDRIRARRRQRARLANWSFAQLGYFVQYKARLAGVLVVFVDPWHTSQQCPHCLHTAKANRRTQAAFSCVSCGYAASADHVAALNIRSKARAAVNQPNERQETVS
jgi:putative transposase